MKLFWQDCWQTSAAETRVGYLLNVRSPIGPCNTSSHHPLSYHIPLRTTTEDMVRTVYILVTSMYGDDAWV